MFREKICGERGAALLMVLLFSAALLFLGGALVSYSFNEKLIAAHQERGVSLYYIAEAGIEAGVAVLRHNFDYTLPLEGSLGEGGYSVSFEQLDGNRRKVSSTGRLGGDRLTLVVIVGMTPLYEKALTVSNYLYMENSKIFGDLHVNEKLHLKHSNFVLAYGQSEGEFSYSSDLPHFLTPQGDIRIGATAHIDQNGNITNITGGATYISSSEFADGAMKAPPIPLPMIDFEVYNEKIEHTLSMQGGTLTLTKPPDCYPAKSNIEVPGHLTIAPQGRNNTFIFDGMIVVRGNLEIHPKNNAKVELNGLLVVDGAVSIKGAINEGRDDATLVILARGNIDIKKDALLPEEFIFGGRSLLFTNENLNIGPIGDVFKIRGAVMANQLNLRNCDLYYDRDLILEYSPLLPGFGVVITEWLRP